MNLFSQAETVLSDLSTQMLAGAGVKFGKDSSEYEKAGGTRTSEIKRTPRASRNGYGCRRRMNCCVPEMWLVYGLVTSMKLVTTMGKLVS